MHTTAVVGEMVTTGSGLIVTVIGLLALSHPPTVWLTYHVVLPTLVVGGMGAMGLPVPPVGVVYQSRLAPVAVKAVAVTLRQ